MKNILTRITLVLAVLISFEAYGQVTVEWDKTYGSDRQDEFSSMIRTADGGYLLGGTSNSSASFEKSEDALAHSFKDYWIVKTDASGKVEWDKTIGGSHNDELTTLTLTSDGGYLIGGRSTSPASGDKTEGVREQDGKIWSDFWVIRTDADGNILWDKTIGGNSFETLQEVIPTSDGGFLLGGYSYSDASGDKTANSNGDNDMWLVKIDANGNKLWDKSFGTSVSEILNAMLPTKDGGFLLGGSRQHESCDPDEPSGGHYNDYLVVKVDEAGNLQWEKTYGGCGGDVLKDMVAAANGGFLIGGYSSTGISGDKTDSLRGYEDYWVVRIDANGTKLWDGTYGGQGFDNLSAMVAVEDGGFLLGGQSYSTVSGDKTASPIGYPLSDYWLVKIDATGHKLWDESFGGASYEQLKAILPGTNGHFILGGYSSSNASGSKSEDSRGSNDYWVLEIKDASQESPPTTPAPDKLAIEWDATFGGSRRDYISSAVSASDGGYLLGGHSPSEASGDKSEPSVMDDFWLVKTDEKGQKLWDKTYGAARHDYLVEIVPLEDGGYLLAGNSSSGANGDKTDPLNGEFDFWVVRIDAEGNKLWDNAYGSNNFDNLNAVVPTEDGGFLLGGRSSGMALGDRTAASRGGDDFWIVKIDASGNKQWDRAYGGSDSDQLQAILPTADGGYLLGGISYSGISGDKTEEARKGTTSVTPDGETVIIGSTDYWIVKIDAAGNQQWDKTLGGADMEILRSLALSPDGGYLVGGSSSSEVSGDKTDDLEGSDDFWIVKLDSEGNQVWDRSIGGTLSDHLYQILPLEAGGYLLAGYSHSNASGDKTEDSKGARDYWLVWVDAMGKVLQDQTIGGSSNEWITDVIHISEQEFLLAGSSESNASGDKTEDSRGFYDYWIVKVGGSEDGGEEPEPTPVSTPGLVIGGGWINSPAGAITNDPMTEGKATLSLRAEQKVNENYPKGNVTFNIPREKFRFRSDSLEWMRVSEDMAIVKGTGMLNREEGYSFVISVMDKGTGSREPKDTYRIIIRSPEGELVYDNQRGSDVYAEASMPIGGGNIIIREENSAANPGRRMSVEQRTAAITAFKAYPTQLDKDGLWIEIPVLEGVKALQLSIMDMQGRVMSQSTIATTGKEGKHNLVLNTANWPSGTYIITIRAGGRIYQQKLIK